MYIYTYIHTPLTTSRYLVRGVLPLRLSTKAVHKINKNCIIQSQHYHHGKHNLMPLWGIKYLKMPYKIFILNIMFYESKAFFLQNSTNMNAQISLKWFFVKFLFKSVHFARKLLLCQCGLIIHYSTTSKKIVLSIKPIVSFLPSKVFFWKTRQLWDFKMQMSR